MFQLPGNKLHHASFQYRFSIGVHPRDELSFYNYLQFYEAFVILHLLHVWHSWTIQGIFALWKFPPYAKGSIYGNIEFLHNTSKSFLSTVFEELVNANVLIFCARWWIIFLQLRLMKNEEFSRIHLFFILIFQSKRALHIEFNWAWAETEKLLAVQYFINFISEKIVNESGFSCFTFILLIPQDFRLHEEWEVSLHIKLQESLSNRSSLYHS